MPLARVALMLFLAGFAIGCSKPPGPPRKETYKVKGMVTVDGKAPGSAIQIGCVNVAGMDSAMPTVSQTETKEDGSFEIATYSKGDGVPVGDYHLTFVWQEFSLMSRGYSGPDKLNKRYNDPAKSEIKFSVVDKSVDLGKIELTTK